MGFRLLSALYADQVMVGIWSEDTMIACWLDLIDSEQLWKSARVVGYPILPLTRQITAALPPGPAGRVHYGATTQDIMDTGLALQLGRACGRLLDLAHLFGEALAALAEEHADTVMAARTHA